MIHPKTPLSALFAASWVFVSACLFLLGTSRETGRFPALNGYMEPARMYSGAVMIWRFLYDRQGAVFFKVPGVLWVSQMVLSPTKYRG